MEKSEIIERLNNLKQQYGEWSYDIPLPYNIWTKGNIQMPHTRLKRIVQLVNDTVGKPLSECRVLDLGCLDGQFSIEFAQQGATTLGIEVREANVKKAIFCKEILNLNKLEFQQEDARNISKETHGMFDAIICSGLLYHLTASDSIQLISKMFEMSNKLVIIDTHIALEPKSTYCKDNIEYFGSSFKEHKKNDTQTQKANKLWASWDNHESFWFTRPSLVNILNKAGFSSVYECFSPPHVNFGRQGVECKDRCTFVAIKGQKVRLHTSPVANDFVENLPEHYLDYGNQNDRTMLARMIKKMKRMTKSN